MNNNEWAEIGKKSFARFYNLQLYEVELMSKNPNHVFHEMLSNMNKCLGIDENYFGQKEYLEECKVVKKVNRFDLMDF